MSSWTYALTNKGRQLQAKAQTGIKLEYTRMAVGSGTLAGQSLAAMTALITPVKNLPIVQLKHPEGSTRALVGATLTNADVTTGFYFREIGIYATDPDEGEILYMYANSGATADYIAPSGDGIIQKSVNMNVIVGTAQNVTAIINESLVYVTREEFDEAIENIDVDIPPASLTVQGKVQLSDVVNSTANDRAATPSAVKIAYDEAAAAKQLGVEQKALVVAALNSIGVSASTSETWAQLIPKISGVIRATGNATAADLLTGKTASNSSGSFTGSMANRGAVSQSITTQNGSYTVPAGYHNGLGVIRAVFANLVAANIREGVNIGGVVGNLVEGPKYATGLATTGVQGFDYISVIGSNGQTYPVPYVTVSGLSFKPTRIIIETVTPKDDGANVTTFPSTSELRGGFQVYTCSYTNVTIRVEGNISWVISNGFRLGVREYNAQYRWHAYG